MKFKSSVIVAFSFMTMILASSFAAAQTTNIWGVEIGDVFEWRSVDEYYTITSYSEGDSLSNTRNYIDGTMKYRMDFETCKDWTTGDLGLNVSSTDSTINNVKIEVTYYTIAGTAVILRTFKNYDGEKIETIIPAQISVLSDGLFPEPYTIIHGKDVDISVNGTAFYEEGGEMHIPQAVSFGTFGLINVTFCNGDVITHQRGYTFHYVSSTGNVQKNTIKSYDTAGMSIEVIDIKDYGQDEDEEEDLLIMTEAGLSVDTPIGDYGVSMPNYIDISSLTSLLSVISFITSIAGNGSFIPIPLGFSLPSGMNIMYSDVSKIMESIINLAPSVVSNIVAPLLSLTPPNLVGFLNDFEEEDLNMGTLYNVLILVSFTNFLILPDSVDLTDFGEALEDLGDAASTAVPVIENLDLSNIVYALGEAFKYNKTGDYIEISVQSEALPLIFDSRNGMASIELRMGWDGNIFDKFEFEVNYIQSDFGHVMGFRKYDVSAEEEEVVPWTKQLTNFLLILGGLLGGGSVAMVVKKKKSSKAPFKNVVRSIRPNDDCINGFCPD